MTAFLSDTPTCFATLFFYPLVLILETKEGHDCTICGEKTCGLEHLTLMGEVFDVCASSISKRMFSAPVLLAFFSFSFFDAENGLGFVHQIDFMSCGIYGRDVSTMFVSFAGF